MRASIVKMKSFVFLVVFSVFLGGGTTAERLCFPKDFLFGVSTAAFQIEGAWNVSDKGESIWDHYTHAHPERVFDGSNADVAADSYHQWRRDVQMLKQLRVQYYRFSVAWSRVMPGGYTPKVSKDGVRYYSQLIDALLEAGVQPLVTMHHYDLPQPLQDLGGWTNPIVADYFMDYARVLFETFGDRVQGWITFNEPYTFCREGYGGLDAPGGGSSGLEAYMCAHNLLRAHGAVYRLYHREFQHKQKGFISISIDTSWMEPASAAAKDVEAAERSQQFVFGWIAHPILSSEGDYPPIMRQRIDKLSRSQNYTRSRLPVFTKEEVEMIRGSVDILGLNSYTTYLVAAGDGRVDREPSFDNDMDVVLTQDKAWPGSNSTWLKVVPWGFRKILNWIKIRYNNPSVVVTENGISLPPGLKDTRRVQFIDGYLRALHSAIVEDGCKVIGYTYWSLLDNFEWLRGLSERFGLFEVDYASPVRTRKARLSAAYYSTLASTKCLPKEFKSASLRHYGPLPKV